MQDQPVPRVEAVLGRMKSCMSSKACKLGELTESMAMIPAAATRESVSVDLPTGARLGSVLRHSKPCTDRQQAVPGQKTWLARGKQCHQALTVVNVSDDAHVSDVGLLVHKFTDLVDGKLHHLDKLLCSFLGGLPYTLVRLSCSNNSAAAGHHLHLAQRNVQNQMPGRENISVHTKAAARKHYDTYIASYPGDDAESISWCWRRVLCSAVKGIA